MSHYFHFSFISLLVYGLLTPIQVDSYTSSQIYGKEYLSDSLYYESGPYGGYEGGVGFTDFWQSLDGREWQPQHWPNQINIRAGGSIDGIQIFYGTYRGHFHGGDGGRLNKIRLYNGDRIVKVMGKAGIGPGGEIHQLIFFTKNGHEFGPYGGDEGYPFEATPPSYKVGGVFQNCYLGWISGHSDRRLDSITFFWKCPKKGLLVGEVDILDRGSARLIFDPRRLPNDIFSHNGGDWYEGTGNTTTSAAYRSTAKSSIIMFIFTLSHFLAFTSIAVRFMPLVKVV